MLLGAAEVGGDSGTGACSRQGDAQVPKEETFLATGGRAVSVAGGRGWVELSELQGAGGRARGTFKALHLPGYNGSPRRVLVGGVDPTCALRPALQLLC